MPEASGGPATGTRRGGEPAIEPRPRDDIEWDEYVLLQGKIDRIGDFRFRIKGWAVALVGAMLAALLGQRVPPLWLLSAVPVLGLFCLLEANQVSLQTRLNRRALDLESALRRRHARGNRQRRYTGPPLLARTAVEPRTNWHPVRAVPWLIARAHRAFYVLTVALVVGLAATAELSRSRAAEHSASGMEGQLAAGDGPDGAPNLREGSTPGLAESAAVEGENMVEDDDATTQRGRALADLREEVRRIQDEIQESADVINVEASVDAVCATVAEHSVELLGEEVNGTDSDAILAHLVNRGFLQRETLLHLAGLNRCWEATEYDYGTFNTQKANDHLKKIRQGFEAMLKGLETGTK